MDACTWKTKFPIFMELADRGIFLIYEHSLIPGWDTKSRRHSRRVWIMGYVIGFQYMCVQYLKLLIGWQEGHLACKKSAPAIVKDSYFGDVWRPGLTWSASGYSNTDSSSTVVVVVVVVVAVSSQAFTKDVVKSVEVAAKFVDNQSVETSNSVTSGVE